MTYRHLLSIQLYFIFNNHVKSRKYRSRSILCINPSFTAKYCTIQNGRCYWKQAQALTKAGPCCSLAQREVLLFPVSLSTGFLSLYCPFPFGRRAMKNRSSSPPLHVHVDENTPVHVHIKKGQKTTPAKRQVGVCSWVFVRATKRKVTAPRSTTKSSRSVLPWY